MTYDLYLPQYRALISIEETRILFEALQQMNVLRRITSVSDKSFGQELEEAFPYQHYKKPEIPNQPRLRLVN